MTPLEKAKAAGILIAVVAVGGFVTWFPFSFIILILDGGPNPGLTWPGYFTACAVFCGGWWVWENRKS